MLVPLTVLSRSLCASEGVSLFTDFRSALLFCVNLGVGSERVGWLSMAQQN